VFCRKNSYRNMSWQQAHYRNFKHLKTEDCLNNTYNLFECPKYNKYNKYRFESDENKVFNKYLREMDKIKSNIGFINSFNPFFYLIHFIYLLFNLNCLSIIF
jgi:hypothetical protein